MNCGEFILLGNLLCLDFLNTQIILKDEPVDCLLEFGDFIDWLFVVEVIDEAERKKWHRQCRKQAISVQQVRQFRSLLRQMIEGFAKGQVIEEKSLNAINTILLTQSRYARLEYQQGQYQLSEQWVFDKPSQLLAPIALSACKLLSDIPFQSIKQCQNPSCILYYYDNSKNQKRRWCSMKVCGNRMKAAAHYERKKKLDMRKPSAANG